MKDFLKEYKAALTVTGPVFVGSGREISKKEYLFFADEGSGGRYNSRRGYYSMPKGRKIGVIDVPRFYQYAAKKGRRRQMEAFFLTSDHRVNLRGWLNENHFSDRDIKPYIRYEVDGGDTSIQRGTPVQVMEFMRDPYGRPYVPGSSIKGMLRTIILSRRVMETYQPAEARHLMDAAPRGGRRNSYLNREVREIETRFLHTLSRKPERPEDAVNDELAGLIVSDSAPLDVSDLVLCQKIEVHPDGSEKRLNLLRECLRPGTEIRFTVTIDASLCRETRESLLQAVRMFDDCYSDCILSKFRNADRAVDDVVYLGGGAGYATKTVTYPLLGEDDGRKTAQQIFELTTPRSHQHMRDAQYGVSPHILKCTYYKGALMEFGKCRIRIG